MQVKVPIRTLRDLVTKISRFAGSDQRLPIFATVKLESRDGVLIAAATDRYRIGMARADVDGLEGGFSALLDTGDWKELLKLFPAPKRGLPDPGVKLTVADKRLTVENEGSAKRQLSVSYVLADSEHGEHPDLIPIVKRTLLAGPSGTASFDPGYLSSFAQRGQYITIKATGIGKPAVVLASNFIGLVMAARPPEDGREFINAAAIWADFLGPIDGEAAA